MLFPICGSLRNNKAVIGGNKENTMPRHGIDRKREFELENSDLSIHCTFLLWHNLERPIFYEDRGKSFLLKQEIGKYCRIYKYVNPL